jgi:hypothetical protein
LTIVAVLTLLAAGPLRAAPAFPVKVGPTGRYLVDQAGTPFLITGESPQTMIGNISEADAELFFANRQSHGFNTVWISLLCRNNLSCHADASTIDGIVPFTALLPGAAIPNYDLTTPNEAYFAHVDRVLNLAAQYGFLVILGPIETDGWLTVLQQNGVDRARAYGQYLGQRYASFDNIVWMHGNDYQTWGPVNDPVTTAVALGIQDFDTRHIHTVELNYNVSGSLDDPAWAPIIRLNATYTYYPTYQQVLTDYNRSNFVPTFMVEASYEFENNNPPITSPGIPQVLRRQAYWSLLSGATGQLYGNHYTWPFLSGWKNELDTPGAIQIGYLKALFEPRPWYNLIPDQANVVITAGKGSFGSNDYVTAARTNDGQLVLAYVPSARTLTIDMTRLSGLANARWFDPSAGTFATIAGSPLPNSGSVALSTPGTNAGGDADWVLVLEAQAADTTPPDTTIAGGPWGTIGATTATFTWTGSDIATPTAALVYAYRLDPLELAFSAFGSATTKTYSQLPNGTYTFYVKARDQAGNVDPTPAAQSFSVSVDTTPPDISITSHPPALTNSPSASFAFASTEGGSTFTCTLDAGLASSCASPRSYSGLNDGSHTFQVQATDQAGNVDVTPATFTWTVDTTPPSASIVSGPSGIVTTASASFTWNASDNLTPSTGLLFAYRLDPLESQFSPYGTDTARSYTNLPDGQYTFYVTARDQAGNETLSPASLGFVATTQPSMTDLGPAQIWLGLAAPSLGIKFDLQASVYVNDELIGSGQLNSVSAGVSTGPSTAKLASVPMTLLNGPSDLPSGSVLTFVVSVRNACAGSSKSSGTVRLWFDGNVAGSGLKHDTASRLGAAIGEASSVYFLRNGSALSTTPGNSRTSVDVAVGARCGPFVPFGTWSLDLQ